MIEFNDIKIQSDRFQLSMARTGAAIDILLRNHVDDVAEQTEDRAKQFAPRGPTGILKAQGVVRTPVIEGTVTTGAAFGGGFSLHGILPSGRKGFVGSVEGHSPGDHVYTARVQLNPEVKHAKWVHEGTGLFGPYHSPIVPRKAKFLVFYWHGRKWEKKSVRGQQAQPFLTEAFEYVRNVYEPAKLSQLRAEIRAAT